LSDAQRNPIKSKKPASLMVKQIHKRTPQEKEKIILDIKKLGVTIGCKKYGISKTQYYNWLNRYVASGL
jgi:DNA invertase Pin-like site-specific DNA recombinase